MSKVILQPCGDVNARKHYVDTIEHPISLQKISNFVSAKEISILEKIYPAGKVYVWGVTPGAKNVNINKWNRIEKGDVCLFSRKGGIFASGVETLRQSPCQLFIVVSKKIARLNLGSISCIYFPG